MPLQKSHKRAMETAQCATVLVIQKQQPLAIFLFLAWAPARWMLLSGTRYIGRSQALESSNGVKQWSGPSNSRPVDRQRLSRRLRPKTVCRRKNPGSEEYSRPGCKRAYFSKLAKLPLSAQFCSRIFQSGFN